MEINDFIEKIASQFENPGKLSPDTYYRDHEEWCSLMALQFLAVIYKKYRIRLKADEMRKTNTVEELYLLVKSKQ